jgi:YbbR domain-containing protein
MAFIVRGHSRTSCSRRHEAGEERMVSFLRANLVWMLLSLLLSTGLWVYVTFRVDPEVTHTLSNIPIEIQEKPKTMVVQSETPAVQVEVSTSSAVWAQLKPDKIHAVVDASKVTPPLQQVEVKVTASDPRVRIERIEPSTVFLKVDPLETKTMPVQVVTNGTLQPSYEPGTPTAIPPTVTVSGPKQIVDQISAVTVPVNVDGATRSIDQGFKPVLEGIGETDAANVTISPEQVRIQIPIEQKLSYKTLPVAPDVQGTVALGYQIVGVTVDPQTVLLVGDPQTLNQMTTVPTQPVDVSGADGDRAYDTTLKLPGTVAMARSQTFAVRVLVSTVNGSKTILVSPQVTNLGSNLTYTVSPGAVDVTLSGPIPILNRIQPSDVSATIDATGLTSGSQALAVHVKNPDLLKVVSVQPQKVTLTVKSISG